MTSSTAPTSSPTDEWPRIKQVFLGSAENQIGFKVKKRKCWISDNTWNLINERETVKNLFNCAKTISSKAVLQQRYSDVDRQIKKSARTDKRIWNDNIASMAQSAAETTHRTRDLYRTIRSYTNTSNKAAKPFKDENGEIMTSKDKQIHIWQKYYEKLLSEISTQPILPCECPRHLVRRDIRISSPDESEIVSAIGALKANKAPGPDNINPELLKADP